MLSPFRQGHEYPVPDTDICPRLASRPIPAVSLVRPERVASAIGVMLGKKRMQVKRAGSGLRFAFRVAGEGEVGDAE